MRVALLAMLLAAPPVDLTVRAVLYGDNTEFFDGFRQSDTTLGAFAHVAFRVTLGPRAELLLGAFGNQRFGSDDAFEEARPVLSLRVGSERSRFVFGTLETVRQAGAGPDRTSPHGLLPPLQVETLAFTRPYEAGAQWLLEPPSGRLRSDTWLSWQRLGTAGRREVLDAGVNATGRLWKALSAGLQAHYVHQGGQTNHGEPIADSLGAGAGVIAVPLSSPVALTLELWGLLAREERDRERPELTTRGHGWLFRAAAERRGLRAHLIAWKGRDFVKREGDPNYHSRSDDGLRYRSRRRYGELGLAKLFEPAGGVSLEVSGRVHAIDGTVEYSYRLLGRVAFELGVLP